MQIYTLHIVLSSELEKLITGIASQLHFPNAAGSLLEVLHFFQAGEVLTSICIDIKHPILFFRQRPIKIFQIYGSSGRIFFEKRKVILALGEIIIIVIAVEQMIDYLFFGQVVDSCMDLYVCRRCLTRHEDVLKTLRLD